jgi:hypothetical protein
MGENLGDKDDKGFFFNRYSTRSCGRFGISALFHRSGAGA